MNSFKKLEQCPAHRKHSKIVAVIILLLYYYTSKLCFTWTISLSSKDFFVPWWLGKIIAVELPLHWMKSMNNYLNQVVRVRFFFPLIGPDFNAVGNNVPNVFVTPLCDWYVWGTWDVMPWWWNASVAGSALPWVAKIKLTFQGYVFLLFFF